MPDWNPAEIIGIKPNQLSTSLYKYLIMDSVWSLQRFEYGYRDLRFPGTKKNMENNLKNYLGGLYFKTKNIPYMGYFYIDGKKDSSGVIQTVEYKTLFSSFGFQPLPEVKGKEPVTIELAVIQNGNDWQFFAVI